MIHSDPPLSHPPPALFPPEPFLTLYRDLAGAPFPIMLCLHLTHQTVAVPAARAPAQITTRQLIELFFSSQAGGHCKNIPTLEYGFLVQVRPQRDIGWQWQGVGPTAAFVVLFHHNTLGRARSRYKIVFCDDSATELVLIFLSYDNWEHHFPPKQIMKYSEQRIPTLNEYCVVCDEQHVFQNGSMLKVLKMTKRFRNRIG